MSPNIYAHCLLKVSVSQMLQTIGFQSVQSSALDVLVEILERYIQLLSKTTRDFAEISNRNEPTLDDVASAFNRHKIYMNDLEDYINWVDTPEFALKKITNLAKNKETANTKSDLCCISSDIDFTNPNLPKNYKKKNYFENLGYCDDPNDEELASRQSDEENEHVYDYLPLINRAKYRQIEEPPIIPIEDNSKQQIDAMSLNKENLNSSKNENKNKDTTDTIDEDKTSSFVTKNGEKFKKYTWKSSYEPKHIKKYLNKKTETNVGVSKDDSTVQNNQDKPSESYQMDISDIIPENRPSIISAPKLPPYFHKPRSKSKKQIYSNAISILNKSLNSLLGKETLALLNPVEEVTDEAKKPVDLASCEQTETIEAKSEKTVSESNKTDQLMNTSEDNLIDINTEAVTVVNDKNSTNKMVSQMMESLMTKYKSTPSMSSSSDLTKAKIKPIETMDDDKQHPVVQSLPLTENKIPKFKIKTNQITPISIDDEPVKPKETIESKQVIGIDLNSPLKNKSNINDEYTFNDENQLNQGLPAKKSVLNDNYDNFDDNAMDGSAIADKRDNQASNASINEPLIWKPVFNLNNTKTNSNSSINDDDVMQKTDLFTGDKLPKLKPFSIKTTNIKSPPASSDISIDKPNSSVVNPSSEAEPASTTVIDSSGKHKKKKKNKDKEKDKDKDKKHHHKDKKKDKEKEKRNDDSSINQQESDADKLSLNNETKSESASESNVSISDRKKEKKLKKLLKKEQKRREKEAAAAAAAAAASESTDLSSLLLSKPTNENESNTDSDADIKKDDSLKNSVREDPPPGLAPFKTSKIISNNSPSKPPNMALLNKKELKPPGENTNISIKINKSSLINNNLNNNINQNSNSNNSSGPNHAENIIKTPQKNTNDQPNPQNQPLQPPLPKLKLKLKPNDGKKLNNSNNANQGNSSSLNNSLNLQASNESFSINPVNGSDNLVLPKPKLNPNSTNSNNSKHKSDHSSQSHDSSDKKSNQVHKTEEEVELGEIVKPKPSPNQHNHQSNNPKNVSAQGEPKQQLPKLIIKPVQKTPKPENKSNNQQQAHQIPMSPAADLNRSGHNPSHSSQSHNHPSTSTPTNPQAQKRNRPKPPQQPSQQLPQQSNNPLQNLHSEVEFQERLLQLAHQESQKQASAAAAAAALPGLSMDMFSSLSHLSPVFEPNNLLAASSLIFALQANKNQLPPGFENLGANFPNDFFLNLPPANNNSNNNNNSINNNNNSNLINNNHNHPNDNPNMGKKRKITDTYPSNNPNNPNSNKNNSNNFQQSSNNHMNKSKQMKRDISSSSAHSSAMNSPAGSVFDTFKNLDLQQQKLFEAVTNEHLMLNHKQTSLLDEHINQIPVPLLPEAAKAADFISSFMKSNKKANNSNLKQKSFNTPQMNSGQQNQHKMPNNNNSNNSNNNTNNPNFNSNNGNMKKKINPNNNMNMNNNINNNNSNNNNRIKEEVRSNNDSFQRECEIIESNHSPIIPSSRIMPNKHMSGTNDNKRRDNNNHHHQQHNQQQQHNSKIYNKTHDIEPIEIVEDETTIFTPTINHTSRKQKIPLVDNMVDSYNGVPIMLSGSGLSSKNHHEKHTSTNSGTTNEPIDLSVSSKSITSNNLPPILTSSSSMSSINHPTSSPSISSKSAAPMTIIGTAVQVTNVVNNQLWICPSCNKPEDTLPMIGCDSCDDWYHWHCIGITKEPPKNQNWYCHKCGTGQSDPVNSQESNESITKIIENPERKPKIEQLPEKINKTKIFNRAPEGPDSTPPILSSSSNSNETNRPGPEGTKNNMNVNFKNKTNLDRANTTPGTSLNNSDKTKIENGQIDSNNDGFPFGNSDGASNYLSSLKKKKRK